MEKTTEINEELLLAAGVVQIVRAANVFEFVAGEARQEVAEEEERPREISSQPLAKNDPPNSPLPSTLRPDQ